MDTKRTRRLHAMAQLTELEQQQEGKPAASALRVAAPVERQRSPVEPVRLHPASQAPAQAPRRPLWHKDNVAFWLAVCVAISLVFSLVYRAIG